MNNRVRNQKVPYYNSGIRYRHFGTKNDLVKYPLIKSNGKIKLITPHVIGGGFLADISGALLHYKLVPPFFMQASSAVRNENYWRSSIEYKKYHDVLKREASVVLKSDTSIAYRISEELVKQKFMVTSKNYIQWIISYQPPLRIKSEQLNFLSTNRNN